MAGEWLKVELSTPDKPEILKMARILGIDKDCVFGKLIRIWGWFDKNSVDGVVDGVVAQDIDTLAFQDGFCAAMSSVGWITFDDEQQEITLPKFDRHNGETAKRRALKNERQAKWRASKDQNVDVIVDTNVDIKKTTKSPTREEKRKDIYIPPIPDNLLKDFLAVRKAKKVGPLTETAFNGIDKEAKKAGITVIQAVEYCCKRGWAGFEASWLSKDETNKPRGLVL